jgi:uncharacterized protein YuzE
MVSLSAELVEQLVAVSQSAPAHQIWVDYDAEADVLYLSFRKPQQANDSLMQPDGSIYHYHDDELVGITVPHAAERNR